LSFLDALHLEINNMRVIGENWVCTFKIDFILFLIRTSLPYQKHIYEGAFLQPIKDASI